ncbi:MAG: hypothetical protein G01um101413_643 [Parcubacteria group bacterium Gr01-1014_13]|nr:MAG: hypothetical protein G01um101413_643 [Parcubacteria group bacterium Gr01-1014_13]
MDDILLCIFVAIVLVAATRHVFYIIYSQRRERDFVRDITMASKKKDKAL